MVRSYQKHRSDGFKRAATVEKGIGSRVSGKEVKIDDRREGKSMWKLQQVVKQHCQQFLFRLQIRELELN